MEAQAARLPAALGLLAIALAAATPQHGVIVEKNVPAAMRDGTILRADIYRPDAPGRFPALLQRTPYSKNTSGGRARSESLSAKGYVVVIQDTRGRYTSDGIARQHDEAEDGYDTVEWVASLPFVDGRVGMFGGSYLATTQLMAATLAPPRLVALFPSSSYASRYDMVFQGGAFYLGDGLAWNLGQAADVRRRILDPTADRDGPLGLTREQRRLLRERWLWHLPLKTMDALELSRFAPGYRLMLEHSSYDEFWETFDIAARHDRFEVAALHVTGWYDTLLSGTLRNFSGLRANARTERGRAGQRLIVGPWTHSGPTPASTSIGDVDFGPDAGLDARGLMEHGRLTTTAPGAELPDRFLYDPSDPVPTLGMSGYSRAPADQRQLEEWRADNSQPGPAERPPASPHAYGALGLGRLANALREPRASHIYFVVRDDDGEAELLFQTSDTTWQAYNQYGGASTYGRLDRDDRGPRAYKVSYNRPFETRAYRAVNLVFNAEYPMVRWLEANGYDGAGASCGCRLTGGLPLSLPRRDPDPMPHPRRPRRPEARRSESSAVPSMTALTSRARVRA